MTFLSPLFLGAAGAAVLPLVLHLMAKRNTVRMNFSTVRFLKLAQKQSSTKIRMENFLLWLIRTLLMLLLALAFAKPVARLSGHSSFGSLLGSSRRAARRFSRWCCTSWRVAIRCGCRSAPCGS